jgi:hypothetical protein
VIRRRALLIVIAIGVVAMAGCSSGSSSTFSLSGASVDQSYACPVGANNARYDVHGTIDAHNTTSTVVTISSIDANMTLAAVKGGWLEKVGDRYDAGNATFTPASVGAGASSTINVTFSSACTGRVAGAPVSSGDYAVTFTLSTSAGTFKIDSKDRHSIVTG